MSTALTNLFGFGDMKTKILPKSSNAVSLTSKCEEIQSLTGLSGAIMVAQP